MKKALATIMGLAFAFTAMAGRYLIYDYNVTFKRVDAQFTKVTYAYGDYDSKRKDYSGYFDSFKTASDKLTGVVILPACDACGGDWGVFDVDTDEYTNDFGSATYAIGYSASPNEAASAFAVTEENKDAFVIVTRNGDDLEKNPYLSNSAYNNPVIKGKLVWVMQAHVDSAMFGKGAAVRMLAAPRSDCADAINETAGFELTPTDPKAAKEAWLVLTYGVPTFITPDDTLLPPVKGMTFDLDCPHFVDYGFLGYLCKDGNVSNAGFGTVTTTTTKKTEDIGFCGGKVKDKKSCIAINSISGSTIGYFNYGFLCYVPALFDICTKIASVDKAPMAGTFTFKLNQSASKNYGESLGTAKSYVDNVKFKKFEHYVIDDDIEW